MSPLKQKSLPECDVCIRVLIGRASRAPAQTYKAGDKQKRPAKIQQALEADAKAGGGGRASHRGRKEQQRQAEGRKKPGKPAAPP